NMTTPNGEAVHYNVFRKMLPDLNGVPFTPASFGQTNTYTFNYALNPAWNANEMYVVAFLQNPTTKDVLNSGTKFDPAVSATKEAAPRQSLRIAPNPVNDQAIVQLDDDQAEQVEVFAGNGQRVLATFSNEQNTVTLATGRFAPGIYYLKITGKKGVYTGKMVKQ
ncbi:MAG: T9SS type A sorting domain-containing protein, partial [Saprospiraceae bacterium]